MSQHNSVPAFANPRIKEIFDSLGITQFPSEKNWYQVIGGLIVQGGFIDNAATGTTVALNASFPKQVLGIFLQPVDASGTSPYISAVTVDDFVVNYGGGGTKDFYWFAIGV